MHLAAVQFDIVWEEKSANFAKVRALVEAAHLPVGTVVHLPEMFATGFSMNVAEIYEPDGGETEKFLSTLAADFQLFVTGGVVKKSADSGMGLNQSVTFDPAGKLVRRYSKIHPFTFGEESKHYIGGNEIVTFDAGEMKVCPFVCYDLRFPEIFRDGVSHGANAFSVIANWPAAREHHWVTFLQARAIENQSYVVGVNRCGHDPKLSYSGRSFIVDPRGKILADAGNDERVIVAPVDLPDLQNYRMTFSALRDRRWK